MRLGRDDAPDGVKACCPDFYSRWQPSRP